MRRAGHLLAAVAGMGMLAGCGVEGPRADGQTRGHALTTTSVAGSPFVRAAHGKYAVKLEWLSGEPRVREEGSARLTFLAASGDAARQAHVDALSLWMPEHGHGSVVPPQVNQVAAQPADVVEITDVQLQMSGHWELRIVATVDGENDSAALAFEVP